MFIKLEIDFLDRKLLLVGVKIALNLACQFILSENKMRKKNQCQTEDGLEKGSFHK
jgi:hypothetical protein